MDHAAQFSIDVLCAFACRIVPRLSHRQPRACFYTCNAVGKPPAKLVGDDGKEFCVGLGHVARVHPELMISLHDSDTPTEIFLLVADTEFCLYVRHSWNEGFQNASWDLADPACAAEEILERLDLFLNTTSPQLDQKYLPD